MAHRLRGKRILITRPAHQADKIAHPLRQAEAIPLIFPTIEIRPVDNSAPFDNALQNLAAFDWLVITSPNGARIFHERLTALNIPLSHVQPLSVAAVGTATATMLKQAGITVDLLPAQQKAEGLLAAFQQKIELSGQHVLLPQANIARPVLADGLTAQGATVTAIAAYCTRPLSHGPLPPAADVVTFTSSSTVQGYVNCLAGQDPATFLAESRVACIGPITAQTGRELGVPVHAIADPHSIAGLLTAIKRLLAKNE